jgi:acyl-CoA synthetase (AMP-forming)/AMP-acid ligase II
MSVVSTIPSTLRQVPNPSSEFSDLPALVLAEESGASLTYGQLRNLLNSLSEQIVHLTNATGDEKSNSDKLPTVGIAIPNTLTFVASFLATTWSKCIAAPLNPAYTEDEMSFYLSDSEVNLLIVDSSGNPTAEAAAEKLNIKIATIKIRDGSSDPTDLVIVPKSFQVSESASKAAVGEPLDSDIAMFLHTSGTTSKPKRVPLTHKNMCTTVGNIIATYLLTSQDRSLLVMPLFHVHGLMAGLLGPLYSGACVVIHGKFSASKFWTHVVEYKVNWFTAVPTMLQILLANAEKHYPAKNPPALRFIRSCSASLAPAVFEELQTKFGAPVCEAYAMTEAAHQMTSNPLPEFGPRKPGSVGKANKNLELVILADDGTILEPGKIGEVCIKGDNVTSGYVNNPEANKTAFDFGYFHTGDQGYLDTEGYLFLTGRIKELINRGGEKISPLEIDAILLAHPEVGEAVCFAVPDQMYGQIVGAAVVPRDPSSKLSPEVIKAFCKDKMAVFKIPAQVFVLETMPRTATGKIQRRIVAELLLKPKA